jgi:glycosyltransferase involved in cell wall biosynthesis
MRLLITNWRYVGHPRSGGAEYWTQVISEGLVQRGHQVTVFTARAKDQKSIETLNGVNVIRRGGMLSVYLHARRFFRRSQGNFDVVLDEVNTRPFFAHKHFEGQSIAMFHQIADEVWDFEAPFPINFIGRRVLEPLWIKSFRGERVLALSDSTAESLSRFGVTDSVVIEPGISTLQSAGGARLNSPTVCILGRLVESKRPLDAIFAFQRLQQRYPDARCFVIGDGPLRTKIEDLNLRSVTITGKISDVERNQLVSSSHVLLATSVREGWGMNVTEAAELGALTIGYDVPGLRDSISSTNGILVSPSPSKLAEALINYFQSEVKREPKKFNRNWSEVIDDFEKYFLQMVSHSND